MKGDEKVIEYLNKGLRSELTAISQYWLHYRLQKDWGVGKLAEKSRQKSIEEIEPTVNVAHGVDEGVRRYSGVVETLSREGNHLQIGPKHAGEGMASGAPARQAHYSVQAFGVIAVKAQADTSSRARRRYAQAAGGLTGYGPGPLTLIRWRALAE